MNPLGSARFNRSKQKAGRARELRLAATPAERKLWSRLRGASVEGASFRRQHPAGPYILDFYCPTLRLAIEVDGGHHGLSKQSSADQRREEWLRRRGVIVLRYWNSDIMTNAEGVLEHIRLTIIEAREKTNLVHATWSPPPERGRSGGGQQT